jgi:predicted porin
MVNNQSIDGQTDSKTGSGFEISAKYAMDALSVAGGYRNTKDAVGGAPTSVSDVTNKAFIVGASYDLGMAKIFGQYANVTIDDNLASTSVKNSGESIGVDVPFTSSLTGFVQTSFAKNTTTDQKSTGYAVGAKYDMSKSTFAYADIGGTKFDGNVNGAGLKASQFTVGLVNSF